MTWMMPLLVATSATLTLASLTITPPATVKDSGWPLIAVALMHSDTLAAGTAPATTWY